MEFSEIEKKLVEESKTYTPDVYGNIVAEAQAEGLLKASATAVGGSAVGSSVGGSVGSNAAVKMGALGLKKLVSIIVSAVLAVAIAVTSITVSVLNSNGGGGGNADAGQTTEEGNGNGETGGKGDDEETKITSYVGLTYKCQHISLQPPLPPNASEQERQEYNMIYSIYMQNFHDSTITFSEDSFTLTDGYHKTSTGAVEQEEDGVIKLDIEYTDHIFFTNENVSHVYVNFRKQYQTNEINYDTFDIVVIPISDVNSYNRVVVMTFALEK